MRDFCTLLTAVVLSAVSTLPASSADPVPADLEPLLKTLQAVGPKGAGNREAGRAWQQLVRADAGHLPVILAGLDRANPLAANWIRTAARAIAERELRSGGTLPAAELERFVRDTRHAPRARRLAYEWLLRVDPGAPQRLIPEMLHDPSLEMRRDAVARLIDQATAFEKEEKAKQAVAVYQKALSAARHLDQVKLLADRLRKLGQTVDLPQHFGFLVRWKLIGPFDNADAKGYDAVYPPERESDLQASYDGKHGKVRWIDHVTTDDYGKVDLNKALGSDPWQGEKWVVGYARAEFVAENLLDSGKQQEVQLRSASLNAIKLWLNGKSVVCRNVYHMGSQMDQYVNRVVLKPGRNVILVKVCQNAVKKSWGRHWGFQLRVCDPNGTAVLSTDRDQ